MNDERIRLAFDGFYRPGPSCRLLVRLTATRLHIGRYSVAKRRSDQSPNYRPDQRLAHRLLLTVLLWQHLGLGLGTAPVLASSLRIVRAAFIAEAARETKRAIDACPSLSTP